MDMVSASRSGPRFAGLRILFCIAVLTLFAADAAAQRGAAGDDDGRGRRGRRGAGVQNAPGSALPAGVPLGLRTTAPIPADNPITQEKAELGRLLFFDPALSADRSVSCASCHRPDHGFGDTTSLSAGVHGRLGTRNSPTLLNRVFGRRFFWDGRATSLEEAVLMPVQDTMEMALSRHVLVQRVNSDSRYAPLFGRAFPGDAVTDTTIARAIATYVRTLWTGDSPFDRFQAGDATALTAAAARGRTLFFGRADCSDCHGGPNFTDERFHALGVSVASPERFKTPTLRNVALTAPYMHDGSLQTLDEVVDFYDRGGNGDGNGGRRGRGGRDIRPLRLSTQDRADLVAFLRALTGTVVEAVPIQSASR